MIIFGHDKTSKTLLHVHTIGIFELGAVYLVRNLPCVSETTDPSVRNPTLSTDFSMLTPEKMPFQR
jgi:hypothetical protein